MTKKKQTKPLKYNNNIHKYDGINFKRILRTNINASLGKIITIQVKYNLKRK